METVITTIQGTFVVPADKQASLIIWLQQNAIKTGEQPIREQTSSDSSYTGRQLIFERFGTAI